jgi:hypothetical protein
MAIIFPIVTKFLALRLSWSRPRLVLVFQDIPLHPKRFLCPMNLQSQHFNDHEDPKAIQQSRPTTAHLQPQTAEVPRASGQPEDGDIGRAQTPNGTGSIGPKNNAPAPEDVSAEEIVILQSELRKQYKTLELGGSQMMESEASLGPLRLRIAGFKEVWIEFYEALRRVSNPFTEALDGLVCFRAGLRNFARVLEMRAQQSNSQTCCQPRTSASCMSSTGTFSSTVFSSTSTLKNRKGS